MSTIDQPQAVPPRRSWFSRNWLWFVPLLFVLLFLLCAGLCVGVIGTAFVTLKHSEPYRVALERVQQDPQVIQRLGEPIREASWVPVGEVHTEDGGGSANLSFRVAGPKGEADVRTEARRRGGQWETTVLEVTFPDGKRLSLDVGGDDEAPKFQGGNSPKLNPNGPAPKLNPPEADAGIRIEIPNLDPPGK